MEAAGPAGSFSLRGYECICGYWDTHKNDTWQEYAAAAAAAA
jgi:hypothetical protein